MTNYMMRQIEHLTPMQFLHDVRPFLKGSFANPDLPNGIVYRGVSEIGKKFAGGSLGQSAITPSMDAIIGIQHETETIGHNMRLRVGVPF